MNGKQIAGNQNVWRNKTFLAVMLAGVLVSAFFLLKFYEEFGTGFQIKNILGISLCPFLLKAIFQIIGHYLRAWKSVYLINLAKRSVSSYFLFEALSISFLFNIIFSLLSLQY